MVSKEEKALYAAEVFKRLKQNDSRLAHGYEMRKKMFAQIQKGEKPEGYRPEFIRSAAFKIIAQLGLFAEDFNTQHGDDRLSVHDFLDILETAKKALTIGTKKDG